jgi:excisionase family DNA binding protein
MTEETYYTVKQIAKMLQVSEETVRRIVAEGKLEIVYVGRQVRISRDALDAYLKRK